MIIPYTYPCKVTRVVDGDTIDIELDLGFDIHMDERVRLLNVDTPEIYGRYATAEGQVAKQFVEQWIGSREAKGGKFFYQSLKYNAIDKYGRSLGKIIWIDGAGDTSQELNSAIVKAGLSE